MQPVWAVSSRLKEKLLSSMIGSIEIQNFKFQLNIRVCLSLSLHSQGFALTTKVSLLWAETNKMLPSIQASSLQKDQNDQCRFEILNAPDRAGPNNPQ